jgi:hypothetical protein
MSTDQINIELKAYRLMSEARDILQPIADRTDAELGSEAEIGKIWDELRVT